ncbi:MAG: hypothetical protein RLN60_00840 [Phycisphaerales bacterium]
MTTRTMMMCAGFASVTCVASAAPRDVQFKSVDFETNVIELHNFGDSAEALDGFRACSHDDDQIRQYSTLTSFNGLSIAAGESLFIHFNNDSAMVMDGEQRIDIAGRGNFAGPFDRGPYSIQIYFPPVAFGNGATMADIVQWSIDGVDNSIADERADEAQIAGLWTDQSEWIATTKDSLRIELLDETGGLLHGPLDYMVVEPGAAICSGDCDDSGTIDFNDLVSMLFAFGPADGMEDPCDADESGTVDFNDLVSALFLFGPCP